MGERYFQPEIETASHEQIKAWQDEPSTQEELRSVPLLDLSEIDPEPLPEYNEEREIAGV